MKYAVLYIYLGVLLLSAITAVIYRRSLAQWKLTIMAYYLPLLFIMEVILAWCHYKWPHKSNIIVYNIYKPITLVIFAILYYSLPIMTRFRRMIVWTTAVYLVLIVVAYSFMVRIEENSAYLTIAQRICITFFAVFFLITSLMLDDVEQQKLWQPITWVTNGVLLFYPVTSISTGFSQYLYDYDAKIWGMNLYNVIPQLMSIFMYSCFTYAFYLCQRRSQKYFYR